MKEPLVSVIIPTFNKKRDLLLCLESLKKSSYTNLEIIVVDNASTDGTSKSISNLYSDIKIIKLESNTGVTGGRNAGVKIAKGDFILFLDHDILVDKEMIETLVNTMLEDVKIGAAGSVIYYLGEPYKVWAAGTSVNLTTGKVSFNYVVIGVPYTEVQVLPSVIMVRKEVLQKIGLFDDVFFATYEDTDFCLRVKRAGYKVICVMGAKAWHKTPMNKNEKELYLLNRLYYVARNRIIFMKKHGKHFIIFLVFYAPIYTIYYTCMALKHRKTNSIKEYWRGLFDGIKEILF